MKREVPLTITFISGVVLVIALFVPHSPFNKMEELFNDWYIIVAGFTLILGIDSLLLHHWDKVRRFKEGWGFSLALIVSFFVTLLWGIYSGRTTGSPFDPTASFLTIFYTYIFVPLQATMFALLAFFIASAAYRAFRAHTVNATLLLIAAALVMLGRVPRGEAALLPLLFAILVIVIVFFWMEFKKETTGYKRFLFLLANGLFLLLILLILAPLSHKIFPAIPAGYAGLIASKLPVIADWVMNVPQMAAKRGIFIGVALGSIVMSLRIIFGIERTYLK